MVTFSLDRLGQLVSVIGKPEFGPVWNGIFSETLQAHSSTAYAMPESSALRRVFDTDGPSSAAKVAADKNTSYISGDFLFDPTLQRYRSDPAQSVYVLKASDIQDRRYLEKYYADIPVAYEIGLFGNRGDSHFYVSIYRQGKDSAFQPREVEMLRAYSPLIIDILHRHDEISASQRKVFHSETADKSEDISHYHDALRSEFSHLSHREAEVCAHIILGYSNLAISLQLSVTINTVLTYRKRAYAKLGITSQSELFSRYLSNSRAV